MISRFTAVLSAMLFMAAAFADQAADRAALTEGVSELIAPGAVPGPVSVSGPGAFTVLTAQSEGLRVPLFAAASVGRVRAVAGGHEGFFGSQSLAGESNARFLVNVVTWLGRKPIRELRIGLFGMSDAEQTLKNRGASVTTIRREDIPAKLSEIDVLCLNQAALDRDLPRLQEVAKFIQKGGGILVSGPAWGWMMGAGDKQLATDHTGNYLLRRYGLGLADGMVEGPFTAAGADEPVLNADKALESLKGGGTPASRTAALNSVERLLTVLPRNERDYTDRIGLLAAKETGGRVPTLKEPITADQPFARLRAILEARTYRFASPSDVKANPAAADFPGKVPSGAPRISRTVLVDCKVTEWHGTGLYAAPGEVVRITVPDEAAGKGLGVRIGSHTDTLWHLPKWQRFPEITTYKKLTTSTTSVASAFGGTIFIDVPNGSKLGEIQVTVKNAVAAPRFVRGKTSLAEWRNQIRNAPGPWAELEGNFVILSVPSTSVRDLDDPEALMAYWDRVMDACYTLYAAPRRTRPERYCVDRQISAGYMHSGYPIMTWEDVAKTFCDLPVLEKKDGPLWGFYHEMGHNFQQREWTFAGTGEVTNNLFSVYGREKVVGLGPDEGGLAISALKPEECAKRLEGYLSRGAKFKDWQNDPFLALQMYLQVRKAFGWEPFIKVFTEYRDLKQSERPRSELDKRDQWMIRLSKAVGHDLGPFFQAWGVPTSDAARQSIAALPDWMPADWPKTADGK